MFVAALGVGVMQQCHHAVCLVVAVPDVLGFDVEPEHMPQATGEEPSSERERRKSSESRRAHGEAFWAITAR